MILNVNTVDKSDWMQMSNVRNISPILKFMNGCNEKFFHYVGNSPNSSDIKCITRGRVEAFNSDVGTLSAP